MTQSVAEYPRVLIVVLGRINAADNFNNGLLLRNLFAKWPRENLAQIYSSGDNGDSGFFGDYYQLEPKDRWFGKLFYRLKAEAQSATAETTDATDTQRHGLRLREPLNAIGKRWLMDTGLYELIFRPRLSRAMLDCVERFKPDIIFAQGYNLAFTWLPLMLARRFDLPIIYYPTDDWPSDLYRPRTKASLSVWTHHLVAQSAYQLVKQAAVCIAFNPFMQRAYEARYQKKFEVLMHGDDPNRFDAVQPRRLCDEDTCWIGSTGVFNANRYPLLYDLDAACRELNAKGLNVRATIFPVNHLQVDHKKFEFVTFSPCPSHTDLPAYLKGADVLFLPERFDATAQDIHLSISSKAHLFMLSGTPIIVYSDPATGVARYASQEQWAVVVSQRDSHLLALALEQLFVDNRLRDHLRSNALRVAVGNHNLYAIQHLFHNFIIKAVETNF